MTTIARLTLGVLLAAGIAAAQDDAALLTNPGFEEQRDGAPAGWSVMGGAEEGVSVSLSPDARTGERCLLLIDDLARRRDGAATAGVRQYAQVRPGGAYVFSAWVKNLRQSGPEAVWMQLRFLEPDAVTVVAVAPPADGRWHRFTVAGRAPEGSERCQVYVYTQDAHTSETLVDDVALTAVDPEALGIRWPLMVWGYEGLDEPRELSLRTPIAGADATATLVAPEGEGWGPAVEALQAAIRERTGRELPVRGWERGDSAPGALIAIGNINNNTLIERLWLNRYLRADAPYQGPGEYVLRTVHEPYGFAPRQNVLVIGAVDPAGAERGVARLAELLGEGPQVALDAPLLEVSGAPQAGEAERERILGQELVLDWFNEFSRAARSYRESGDLVWAERAKQVLLACADRYEKDPKFEITWPEETSSEEVGAAWDVVEEAPVFTDEERLRCENTLAVFLLSLTTHVYEWGTLSTSDTITWNHITYPLVGVYWLGRHFDRFYGGLDGRTEAMLAEVRGCFRGQMKSWKPQEDAMGYCSTSPRHTIEYSLAEGDYSYFESGNVRLFAEYMVHCSNNHGDGSGFGDHGYGPAVYETRALPWALWYYRDGRYLWRLRQVTDGEWQSPYDPSVRPEPWTELIGATAIGLHPEVYGYTETQGYYSEGSAPPNVPLEKAFDKIALRASLEPDAPYLLIDGYSRGKHLQYDGNCITRYYADGEDWLIDDDYLVRNTTDHTMLSVIRDGRCDVLEPACAALEHMADLPSATLLQTAVYDYNGIDWRRNLAWIKDRSFALIDEMEAGQPGEYTLDCIFKLLDRGEQRLVDGRALETLRRSGPPVGNRSLVPITDPAPGVAAAMKFDRGDAQLDFAVDLPVGDYLVTTFAYGLSTGADSFWVSVDGGEPIGFHIPIREFGPSSADHTKESPTPNISIAEGGMHRFTITLREGPGVMLDRVEIRDTAGTLRHTIEAEQSPPVPAELVPEARTGRFFIRSDGAAATTTSTRINNIGLGVRYLRERLQRRLDAGERCSTQNVFYNDFATEPRDLDVRRLSEANALLLRDGEPWGIFGSRAEEIALPEALATDAAVYLLTSDYLCVANATRVGDVVAVGAPTSCELDLRSGEMSLTKDAMPFGPAPAQDAVRGLREPLHAALRSLAQVAVAPDGEGAMVETVGFAEAWSLEGPAPVAEPEVSDIHCADLDGDGLAEVIALRSNEVLAVGADGSERWRATTGGRARSVDAGDLTGDGVPEVIVAAEDEAFYVYTAGGELLHRRNVDVGLVRGSGSVRTPKAGMVRITDLEPDGEPDIIVGALSGHLICYDANFEQRWMYPAVAHGTSELRFADLLPTDGLEVLAGSHYGRLYVLTAQGKVRGVPISEIGDVQFDVADIDADGSLELINGSSTGKMICWHLRDGYTWEFNNHGYAHTDVIATDLMGDETPEVLVASATGYVYALDGSGEVLAQAAPPDAANNLTLIRDGDAVREVLVGCADGSVVALTPALEVIRRHRLASEVLLVEAVEGAEIAVAGCRDGSLVALELR